MTSVIDAEVSEWASKLLGSRVSVSPLSGGANNHLFKCQSSEGELVIKRYREQNFGADVLRQEAEVAFLKHAALTAPEFVPELLAVQERQQMIAISLVDGDPYPAGAPIPKSDVDAAMAFYRKINENQSLVNAYPIRAREGFLSISDHLRHAEQRVADLTVEHLPAGIRHPALSAIAEVRRRLEAARDAVRQSLTSGLIADQLPSDKSQLSPGDFGFHNAIKTKKKITFLDFEYAGLDDPSKTLADFFLQPKIPVDPRLFEFSKDSMALALPVEMLTDRSQTLGRLLSVKWLTIILAPLNAERYPSLCARYGSGVLEETSRRLDLVSRFSIFG